MITLSSSILFKNNAYFSWLLFSVTTLLLCCAVVVNGQQKVFYDNHVTYTYKVGVVSEVSIDDDVAYECTMINQWTIGRQPKFYPRGQNGWGRSVFVSHSDAYTMWEPDRFATSGIKALVEEGTALPVRSEIISKGGATNIPRFGEQLMIAEKDRETTKQIYASKVTPYLSTIVRAFPSPCWFSGFYKMDLRSKVDSTKWLQSFTIQSFPWNAGTTPGDGYLDKPAAESLNPKPIKQMTPTNINLSQAPWLTMSKDDVLPVLIWECALGGVTVSSSGGTPSNTAPPVPNNNNNGEKEESRFAGYTTPPTRQPSRIGMIAGDILDPDVLSYIFKDPPPPSASAAPSLSLFSLFCVTVLFAVLHIITF